MKRLTVAVLTAVLGISLLPPSASAVQAIEDLHLTGGPGWRATNRFELVWTGSDNTVRVYRFVGLPWATETMRQPPRENRLEISIPAPPGAVTPAPGEYVVEVRLESPSSGKISEPAFATLRFDDTAPAPATPVAPSGWVGDNRSLVVAIEHPPGPAPASGIHGYAVSLTAQPDEGPCAQAGRCEDAEVDLPGGVGDDRIALGPLPEGVDYVHVAAVSGAGVPSPPRSVPIRVDASAPVVSFAGIPAGWVDHPVAVTAIASDPLSGLAPAGETGPFAALAVDGGLATTAPGGTAAVTVSGEGTHRVVAYARDAVGNLGDPRDATATVRIDETPPRVAFASAQRPDDPELIEASVDDAVAGASGERGAIGVRPAGTSQRFQPLPTVADAAGLHARWSSDDYPPGLYEFRAIGFDAAGNQAETRGRADGQPMLLHNPIKLPTRIESGFGGQRLVWQRCHRVGGGRRCHRESVTEFDKRPAVWTVPYGRSLKFGGRLLSASGTPLGGQRLEIVETFAPGADAAQRRTTVPTGPDGGFHTRLAPGPSRRVEAFFAGTRTLTRDSGRAVSMAVRAGVRLHASTVNARIGGEPVVFSGRLLADEASIPRTGRPIQLQFRVDGSAWSEFRTVPTDRRGRFRYPYAFTDDDSRGIRFQFRAFSPEQAGFPYRPAASRPVAVTGH